MEKSFNVTKKFGNRKLNKSLENKSLVINRENLMLTAGKYKKAKHCTMMVS